MQWCREDELVAGSSRFVAGRSGCCGHGGRRSGGFYQRILMIFPNDLQSLPSAGLLASERIPRTRKSERALDAWGERAGV